MRKLHESTQRKHEKNFRRFLRDGRFGTFNYYAKEHHRLLQVQERITIADMGISEQDLQQANLYLRAICILSDIVEGAGIDLLELLNKYEKFIELPLVLSCEHLGKTARSIRELIDAVGDTQYAESFGDVVDEVKPLIMDTIKEIFNERRV